MCCCKNEKKVTVKELSYYTNALTLLGGGLSLNCALSDKDNNAIILKYGNAQREQAFIIPLYPERITTFRGDFAFLSNMYAAPVKYERLEYTCSEAAYAAQKTSNEVARRRFQTLTGPQAKKAGNEVVIRPNWEAVKLNIMKSIVTEKFRQNTALKQKLLATGSALLIEENTWNDTYWGVCNGVGQNWLGVILMYVRELLKSK